MNNCCVLVCSCDKYSDAFEICSKSIIKFWDKCPYEVFLLTESKNPPKDSVYGRVIHVNARDWALMLHEALEVIEQEYIVFMLEDQWSVKNINQERVDLALSYMEEHTEIAITYLEMAPNGSVKRALPLNEFFNEIPFNTPYRLSCAPAIFRKSYLLEMTTEPISPWDFERILSFDRRGEKVRVLEVKGTNWTRIDETGAIYRGKWVLGVSRYAERIGVQLDRDMRSEQSQLDVCMRRIKDFLFNINPNFVVKIQRLRQNNRGSNL